MKIKAILVAACLIGPALAACTPAGVLIGSTAVVARSVVQERTTMDALRDTEIKISMENQLLNHSGELFRDVSVDVTEGRVLLAGSVPLREHKIEASRMAWETGGVIAVDDELTVAEDSGTMAYLADVRISNTLRIALLTDRKVSSVNYNVETVDRVVHLTGLAKSDSELQRVIRRAQEVSGVERVVSHVLTIDDPRRLQSAGVNDSVTATTGG
ncbi:MAG TPA: BON domain-containing protein [Thermohalobaculum sp.]|nr:BON domain-containing protein [Thermohalobaculum sp.]